MYSLHIPRSSINTGSHDQYEGAVLPVHIGIPIIIKDSSETALLSYI